MWYRAPVNEQNYKKYFYGYQIIDSVTYDENQVYFLLTKIGLDPYEDELEWALLRCWNDKWSAVDFDDIGFVGVSLTRIEKPDPRVILMDHQSGYIYSCRDDEQWDEDSAPALAISYDQINTIDGYAYAVGSHRTVMKRTAENTWIHQQPSRSYELRMLDDDPDVPSPLTLGFGCIDGFSEQDIYAAGNRGDVWHFNGEHWRRVDVPTNSEIQSILCAPNGSVYLASWDGHFIQGREDRWTLVEHEFGSVGWGDLSWFKDMVYLASMSHLFRYDHKKISTVDTSPRSAQRQSETTSSLMVVGDDEELVVSGANTIRMFDGSEWSELLNRPMNMLPEVMERNLAREQEGLEDDDD